MDSTDAVNLLTVRSMTPRIELKEHTGTYSLLGLARAPKRIPLQQEVADWIHVIYVKLHYSDPTDWTLNHNLQVDSCPILNTIVIATVRCAPDEDSYDILGHYVISLEILGVRDQTLLRNFTGHFKVKYITFNFTPSRN